MRRAGAAGAGIRGGGGRREAAGGAVGAGGGAWRGLVLARHTRCAGAAIGAGVARVAAAGVAACFHGVVCGASARGRRRERYGAEQQHVHTRLPTHKDAQQSMDAQKIARRRGRSGWGKDG